MSATGWQSPSFVDVGDVSSDGHTFPPTNKIVKREFFLSDGRGVLAPEYAAGVAPAEAEISSWIAEWARRTPDTVAIRFEDRRSATPRWSSGWPGSPARSAGAAAVAEGDRVAYLGQNAPELLDLLFACARLGAILVPLSARMPAAELEVVLANTEPATLIAQDAFVATAREAGARSAS